MLSQWTENLSIGLDQIIITIGAFGDLPVIDVRFKIVQIRRVSRTAADGVGGIVKPVGGFQGKLVRDACRLVCGIQETHVLGRSDGRKNAQQDDDDNEFDQGKSAFEPSPIITPMYPHERNPRFHFEMRTPAFKQYAIQDYFVFADSQ
jgi:hypothetical protein